MCIQCQTFVPIISHLIQGSNRREGTSNEYRGQNVLTSKEEERVRQYVREEREGKKHDISLTLTVFLLLVLYIIDYLLFICKETLTEWNWSKYISCLDKKNCHLQGSIQLRQILEWFFVRRDYDKLPAAALLGRKRTLLALANPFYWFTVNIAICQRHLGKGRRRVEKRCVEKLSS